MADRYRLSNGRLPSHYLNEAMLMLADTYRVLGNDAAAVEIEDELRQTLVEAEPDFALAIEVRRRAG